MKAAGKIHSDNLYPCLVPGRFSADVHEVSNSRGEDQSILWNVWASWTSGSGVCRGLTGHFLLRVRSPSLPRMSPILEDGTVYSGMGTEPGVRTRFPLREPGSVASPLWDSVPPSAKPDLRLSPSQSTVAAHIAVHTIRNHHCSFLSRNFLLYEMGQHHLPLSSGPNLLLIHWGGGLRHWQHKSC